MPSIGTFLLILVPCCLASAAFGYFIAAILFHSGRREADAAKRDARRLDRRLPPRIETFSRLPRAPDAARRGRGEPTDADPGA